MKPPFPDAGSDYHAFIQNLSRFAARVQPWFSAVQAVYTSTRSYGGFANSPARGEPLVDDGVHPSATGRVRISALLHARFLTDDWYRRD